MYNEDTMGGLQRGKKQERIRNEQRNDRAAAIITRSVRSYAKNVRTGMGFTIRRIRKNFLFVPGAALLLLLLLLLTCLCSRCSRRLAWQAAACKGQRA